MILAWYDRAHRKLPWRAPPGRRAQPYHVWLSEIMLQQTTVAAVQPYYRVFLNRWPTVAALAAADLDSVLAAWAGLGYYARARNLHRCAQVVAEQHKGRFPRDEAALRALPGIGPYTAAAIAAIAFDQWAVVVDGNVERVMARLHHVETPLPDAKRMLRDYAAMLTPEARPGDYAQAVMDLGATICTPRNPKCDLCPWRPGCVAARRGDATDLPKRRPKAARPTRYGVVFWLTRGDGAVCLRRRPADGLLGAMMEVPSTPWRETPWSFAAARSLAPTRASWRAVDGLVRHGFTHFALELSMVAATTKRGDLDGVWCLPDQFGSQALPSVMRKVIAHGLAEMSRD